MATYTFANLGDWATKTMDRSNAVIKGSTQRVGDIAQTPKAKGGRMPVLDGILRGSFTSSLNGGAGAEGESSHVLVATAMEAGDVATFGWTAEHAMRLNYGFTGTDAKGRTYNQPGNHFLEGATDQWQRIVDGEIAKAKAAVG